MALVTAVYHASQCCKSKMQRSGRPAPLIQEAWVAQDQTRVTHIPRLLHDNLSIRRLVEPSNRLLRGPGNEGEVTRYIRVRRSLEGRPPGAPLHSMMQARMDWEGDLRGRRGPRAVEGLGSSGRGTKHGMGREQSVAPSRMNEWYEEQSRSIVKVYVPYRQRRIQEC